MIGDIMTQFFGRGKKMSLSQEERRKIDEQAKIFIGNFELENNSTPDVIKLATKEKDFLVQTLNMGGGTNGMILVDEENYITNTNTHRLIVVKKGLPEEKIRFIVAHELGHFCFKPNHKVQLAHREIDKVDKDSEEEKADYFARTLLMPEDKVRAFVNLIENSSFKCEKEKMIKLISVMFSVTSTKAELRYNDIYK